MTQVKCNVCGFPIATNGAEGSSVQCPSCGATGILKRISAVTIPDPLFFGVMGFTIGMVLGPAFLKATGRLR